MTWLPGQQKAQYGGGRFVRPVASSAAIHSPMASPERCSRSSGPTTITDRPE